MRKSPWQYFDWTLLVTALLLTVIGVAMIYSATRGSEDLSDAWRKQAIYAAVGLALMFLVSFVNYRLLESLQWPLYFLALLTLIFTLLFGGSEIGNVRRFIFVGGVSIQPAFPSLILLVISQAGLLARNAPAPPTLPEMLASLGSDAGKALTLLERASHLSAGTRQYERRRLRAVAARAADQVRRASGTAPTNPSVSRSGAAIEER